MISENDKKLLTEVGREYILGAVMKSSTLKDKLSFNEHVELCKEVMNLQYEQVIEALNESIRDFESKFKKFIKYSFAAIAGLPGGFAGPPLTMFVLYMYRKLTDTCTRSCFTKLPFTTARKICKYECQLNAAKKMANQLRNEVSKCSALSNPKKCQKKLQSEYIKWAKRVQMLIIKVQKAKVDMQEKERKQNQKEAQAKARARNIQGESNMSKSELKQFISENKTLRKKLTFEQHLELYSLCKYLKEDDQSSDHFKIDPKKEKLVRNIILAGFFAVPIPGFGALTLYMSKKFSYGCLGKCTIKSKNLPREVCYTQCAYLGAKYAVEVLSKELPKCNKAKDPYKCKKKILNLLEDWRQRKEERRIKFEAALKNAVAKMKERQAKMQGK